MDNLYFDEMFHSAFDTNRDGQISREEFKLSMMTVGEKMTQQEICELFENADSDSDGVLDFSEFVKMLTRSSHGKLRLVGDDELEEIQSPTSSESKEDRKSVVRERV